MQILTEECIECGKYYEYESNSTEECHDFFTCVECWEKAHPMAKATIKLALAITMETVDKTFTLDCVRCGQTYQQEADPKPNLCQDC